MNENIFDKRRLKTFSNCKDLVRSMVGTRDGVIVYNERFRFDLENTCYKASICETLQQENQRLIKEYNKLSSHLYQEQDLRIELQQRIDKAIDKVQYIVDYGFDYDGFNQVDSLKGLIDMLVDYARQTKEILKGEEDDR